MTSLELTLFFLLAAVLGVVIFRSFKLPPMLGYLAVGAVIGPHMLGMVQRSERIQHLAEFGVVFLMFVIGLEFSLPKLRTMKRHVFGLGLLQVLATMMLSTLIILGIRWVMPSVWHFSWQGAVALSGVLAMSSTAIVVKLMAERLELDTEYGKRVMGVLLFQDLAVVPLLVLIPALAANDDDLGMELLLALLKAVGLIAILLTGGQHVMKRWLFTVARRKSSELFMLNILLITLGLAWLTEQAGLSLALGAFIAGMLISETPYKYQVESDIKPFHDLLLGLFFITIGMSAPELAAEAGLEAATPAATPDASAEAADAAPDAAGSAGSGCASGCPPCFSHHTCAAYSITPSSTSQNSVRRSVTASQLRRGGCGRDSAAGWEEDGGGVVRCSAMPDYYARTITLKPGLASCATRAASQLVMRTQPLLSVWPILAGSGVPWMPQCGLLRPSHRLPTGLLGPGAMRAFWSFWLAFFSSLGLYM